MNKINLKYFIIIIALLVILPACTRTASSPPTEIGGEEGEMDFPVLTEIGPTQPPLEFFGTQTFQAKIGGEATQTPVIVESSSSTQEPEAVAEEADSPEESVATATSSLSESTSSSPAFPVFPGYGPGFPTFGVRGVIRDQSVTIQANDFPANQSYSIYMGPMNTGAVNGIHIDSRETNEGGTYIDTYDIPDDLKGSDQIAIRIEFSGGRYAVNWFFNNTTY